ncbi:hypothetical protein IWW51_002971, partial [Coemansia sp. RSA 2702]
PGYSDELVEQTRRMRIRAVKRQGIIYGGIEAAFTVIMAVLLGIYAKRAQDNYDSRYDDHWYRWYIWLLVALLVLNVLCVAYTIWSTVTTVKWLKNPNTPREHIMSGFNPGGVYGFGRSTTVYVQQQPAQGYYQAPPPTYAPDGSGQYPPNNGQYPQGGQYMPPDQNYQYHQYPAGKQ